MFKRNSIKIQLVIFSIFLAIIIFRVVNLSDDTPFGISAGQELSTDPPQYTSFARNKALYGDWEVFYTRYVFFVNNITTLVAYPIFKVFGTGRAQSNFIAVIFSCMSILSSYWAWRQKNANIALIGTAILGFNYVFLSYGKLTFLEVTTVGVASLAAYFLLNNNKRVMSAFIAGVLFAAAAFFSKLLAIIFIPISILVLLLEIYQTTRTEGFKKFNPLYSYISASFFVFMIWLLLVYIPSRNEVSGYLTEISTGMYGAPKALESVKMFLIQLYSYGYDIKLWSKQPVTFATGFLGFAVLAGIIFGQRRKTIKDINRIDLFYLLWFIAAFVILFPWNYRPLRYALLIFPPLCYLSARWIMLIHESEEIEICRKWPYYIIIFVAGSYIVFQFITFGKFDQRSLELYWRNIPSSLFGGLVIAFIGFLVDKLNVTKFLSRGRKISSGKIISVLIIMLIVTIQFSLIFSNAFKKEKTIFNASKDLGQIVSPNAVIIGSYSSALTQNNNLRSVIKMFGVPVVERDFFNTIPATHIAVEAGGGETSNEGRAFKDYPDIMQNAIIITTYYIRGYPVNIYLISNGTPNGIAKSYQPTVFEKAAIFLNKGDIDSCLIMLNIFESQYPGTLSANLMRSKIYLDKKDYNNAKNYLTKALEIDKENLNLWWLLGDLCLRITPPNINEAYDAFKKALNIRPGDKSLIQQIAVLEQYRK